MELVLLPAGNSTSDGCPT